MAAAQVNGLLEVAEKALASSGGISADREFKALESRHDILSDGANTELREKVIVVKTNFKLYSLVERKSLKFLLALTHLFSKLYNMTWDRTALQGFVMFASEVFIQTSHLFQIGKRLFDYYATVRQNRTYAKEIQDKWLCKCNLVNREY